MVGSLTFQIPRPGFHRSDARERGAVDAYSGCGDPGRPRAFRSTDADRRVVLRLAGGTSGIKRWLARSPPAWIVLTPAKTSAGRSAGSLCRKIPEPFRRAGCASRTARPIRNGRLRMTCAWPRSFGLSNSTVQRIKAEMAAASCEVKPIPA
jgi:hypothetical protein